MQVKEHSILSGVQLINIAQLSLRLTITDSTCPVCMCGFVCMCICVCVYFHLHDDHYSFLAHFICHLRSLLNWAAQIGMWYVPTVYWVLVSIALRNCLMHCCNLTINLSYLYGECNVKLIQRTYACMCALMHIACHAASASTLHFNYEYADKQNVHPFLTSKNSNLRTCFFFLWVWWQMFCWNSN